MRIARRPVIALAGSGGRWRSRRPPCGTRTTAVGVGLHEFRVAPYRDRVLPGTVKFNVTNRGEDPHDFVVRTPRARWSPRTGELRPACARACA